MKSSFIKGAPKYKHQIFRAFKKKIDGESKEKQNFKAPQKFTSMYETIIFLLTNIMPTPTQQEINYIF